MKKLITTIALSTLSSIIYAQVNWPRTSLEVGESANPVLGTSNYRSLNFVTNDTIRAVTDSNGYFRVNRLAGRGYRLVYVDSLGNLGARGRGDDLSDTEWSDCDGNSPSVAPSGANDPFPCPSGPCIINAVPWFEGGNRIGNSGVNKIGTCNNVDFILKANNSDRIWIKTDGKIGIGTSSPSARLELQDATNAEIIATNTAANPASFWAMNTSDSYALLIDNSGVGHISQGRGSINNLMGFKYNASNTIPEQVWVGTRPTTGTHTDFNFCVGGKAVCKSLYVSVAGTWADYVFDKNYRLPSLNEVDAFIHKYGHLPNVPSANEITNKDFGLNIAEMQKLQMEKIEELFLYIIKLEKELETLRSQNAELLKSFKK